MAGLKTVRFMDHEGHVAGLAREGRTLLHIVVIDGDSIRVIKRPIEDTRYMTQLMKGNAPYPVKKFARKLRRLGRPITAEAKEILKLAEGQP